MKTRKKNQPWEFLGELKTPTPVMARGLTPEEERKLVDGLARAKPFSFLSESLMAATAARIEETSTANFLSGKVEYFVGVNLYGQRVKIPVSREAYERAILGGWVNVQFFSPQTKIMK